MHNGLGVRADTVGNGDFRTCVPEVFRVYHVALTFALNAKYEGDIRR